LSEQSNWLQIRERVKTGACASNNLSHRSHNRSRTADGAR
jgi:hypothetical protein